MLGIVIDILCSLVAILIVVLSLYTFKVMRAKGIKRSLWMPVLASGFFFLLGNVFSILHEVMTVGDFELLHHVSWFMGLCILAYGVYTYLEMIRK